MEIVYEKPLLTQHENACRKNVSHTFKKKLVQQLLFSEIDKNFEGKVYISFQIVTENSCQVSEKKTLA